MPSALRRIAALTFLVLLFLQVDRPGATWGASPPGRLPARSPHAFDATSLATERQIEERAESAVVLVVLDGVRWQEVFGGVDGTLARERRSGATPWASARALMPNLHGLVERGGVALGRPGAGPRRVAEIVATGPQFISLPGYLEIFAGRPDPACESNECARPPARTIADDVLDATGADDVAIVASWPNIARAASADPSRFRLTAGRRRLECGDDLQADPEIAALLGIGARTKAWPGEGDYRPDALTGRIALRVLETIRPRFLFVGLGDADEYAHRSDYGGYLQALRDSDAFLGALVAALDGMGARGRHTTVLVTTDHGRSYDFRDHGRLYPESSRVWLVAGGDDVRGVGEAAPPRRHTLSDIAPTVRALLGIARTAPATRSGGGSGPSETIGGGDGEPIREIVGR